jgi:diadenosine tetraphosphate (Ap4A) HIT family hydrolase
MAQWGDAEEWAGLVSSEGCPICRQGKPVNIIADLDASWLVMGDDAPGPPLPGTCALFSKRHAAELHELAPDEACAFMRDVLLVSAAVQAASGAVKMNYEVHGNTIPHLHMHFFPRQVGDPFEHGPIEPRQAGTPEGLRRHREIRDDVIRALNPEPAMVPA